MTFVNRSAHPNRLHNFCPRLSAYGGTAKVIGSERMNRLSKTKAPMVRGFMPTCIARKAMTAMQRTGTREQESLFAGSCWMRSGSASREIYWLSPTRRRMTARQLAARQLKSVGLDGDR